MGLWAGVSILLWLAPAVALGQAPEAGPEGPSLPVLRSEVVAAYPRRALERALEAEVRLRIEVSDIGQVLEVEVIGPAGHGFDEAAEAAARGLVFDPARDADGDAVSAEISFDVAFRLAEVVPLSVEGVVKEQGSPRKRLAGAEIQAQGPDGRVAYAKTDAEGSFRLAGLEPGEWVLTVGGVGLVPSSASVAVPEGDFVEGVTLFAARREEFDYADFDIYVEVVHHAGRAEIAERAIDADIVVTLPGSLGDPVRALQNMPGVGRAPFGSGQLLVRGTDPEDTGYHIDGMRVPIVFHFSGISTVVNADLLDELVFLPGSWSTRYGRSLGGVVDLQVSADLPRSARTYASADVFQATAFTAQRLGGKTGLVLSVRRSYIDTILNPILADLGAGAVRTPRYFDAQLHLFRRVARGGTVGAMFLLSDDRFRVVGDTESTSGDAVSYRTGFQKLLVSWVQPLDQGWSNETRIMVGPEVRELTLEQPGEGVAEDFGLTEALVADLPPDGDAAERLMTYALRQEFLRSPGEGLGARLGVDARWGRHELDDDFGADLHEDEGVVTPALYAEPMVGIGELTLSAGLRWEGLSQRGVWHHALDPRGSARLELGTTTVTVGGGQYSQPPLVRELLSEEGVELGLERAWHLGATVEQQVGPDLSVEVAGYSHLLLDLVVGQEGIFRFDQTTIRPANDTGDFANDGVGRTFGVETLVRYETERTIGWLSASLGRSQRIDRPGDAIEPAEFEQPIQVTAIASRDLGRRWRIGTRVRGSSGPPLTPVVNRVFLVDGGGWAPVYGKEWSSRSPAFFAVDLRADKEWEFNAWRLSWYLEVQNLTNHRNVEIPAYSTDYSRFEPVYGLPILPAFGLRGEW